MCELVSAATMATVFGEGVGALTVMQVAGLAGTALSAYAVFQQAEAGEGQAQYAAQVAENNRIVAERNASDAILRGNIAEETERRKVALLTGEMTARMGGSGGSIDNETSQGSLLADMAEFGELDALTIRGNAEREAYMHRVNAGNFSSEASMQRAKADQISAAMPFQVGGTLLSGASQVAAMNYRGSDLFRRSMIA